MKTKPDISKMSKDQLLSELNALNYRGNWTPEDLDYRDRLCNEYNKWIEFEAEESAKSCRAN
jgi:hypothetical protein